MAKVADFKPAARNANDHTQRGMKEIDRSMRTDGYGDPMLAAADGEMISGSARLETVVNVFGMEVEPIVVHSDGTRPIIHVRDDIPNAQDKRAVRLALAANRAAELDLAWDVEVLAGLDADVLEGLWTADELSDLGQQWADEQKAAQEDPGAQVDKAEELQAKWNVQPGDLWQLGAHRLICGDCTDAATVARVMGGERAGAVVTDPPFGIDFKYNEHDDSPDVYDGLILSLMDQIDAVLDSGFVFVWQAMLQCSKWHKWFPAGYRLFAGVKNFVQFRPTAVQFSWDPVIFWQVGKPDIKPIAGMRDYHVGNTAKYVAEESNGHPCPRPEDTVTYIVEMVTTAQATVYDPFSGSGTTLIACESLGRKCRAIEISAAYCAVALERWATMTGQTPVLIPSMQESSRNV